MSKKVKAKSPARKAAAKKPAAKKAANKKPALNGAKTKKNWTMAELLKLSANEVTLLAWQASYENRQKGKRLD